MPSAPPQRRTPAAGGDRRRRTPVSPSSDAASLEAARSSLLARAFCYDDPGSYAAGVEAAFAAITAEQRERSA